MADLSPMSPEKILYSKIKKNSSHILIFIIQTNKINSECIIIYLAKLENYKY